MFLNQWKYADEDAAIIRNDNPYKLSLTTTQFVRELDYGTNKDSYWFYEQMIIQLEDCLDFLKVEFIYFHFLFYNGKFGVSQSYVYLEFCNVRISCDIGPI